MRAEKLRKLRLLKKRREQAQRNAEAVAEAEKAQSRLPGYRPKATAAYKHEAKMIRHDYEDKMDRGEETEDKALEVLEGLEGLSWASPAAFGRAQARGLHAEDFDGETPSGASGGYTVADVNRVSGAKGGS